MYREQEALKESDTNVVRETNTNSNTQNYDERKDTKIEYRSSISPSRKILFIYLHKKIIMNSIDRKECLCYG